MTPVITLALAVAVLLVVFAMARLTRLVISIKARLDALERNSRRMPRGAARAPRMATKTRSTLSGH
jgi:hypothetical protein